MTLYDLLTTSQDVRMEVHLFENFTTKLDENYKVIPCKEVEVISDKSNTIFLNLTLNRYHTKGKLMQNAKVFFIGYKAPRSKVLRVNCEIIEG